MSEDEKIAIVAVKRLMKENYWDLDERGWFIIDGCLYVTEREKDALLTVFGSED